jgi:hypothetical protein
LPVNLIPRIERVDVTLTGGSAQHTCAWSEGAVWADSGMPTAIYVEYFFDHARIEDMLFEDALTPRGGALEPDRSRPGFGLELKPSEAARYAA